MRPLPNSSPFRYTVGTAMICRDSTSLWYSAPSMTTVCTRGLSTAISDSACTTSGQLWQLSDIYTSKR